MQDITKTDNITFSEKKTLQIHIYIEKKGDKSIEREREGRKKQRMREELAITQLFMSMGDHPKQLISCLPTGGSHQHKAL